MISVRQCDRRVADRVLRRIVGAPNNRNISLTIPDPVKLAPTPWGESVANARSRANRIGYARHIWTVFVRPDVYDMAKFYAALGRVYATAIRRYDRGHPPPLGTWEARLVARDYAESTTPAALPSQP